MQLMNHQASVFSKKHLHAPKIAQIHSDYIFTQSFIKLHGKPVLISWTCTYSQINKLKVR